MFITELTPKTVGSAIAPRRKLSDVNLVTGGIVATASPKPTNPRLFRL